MPCFNEVFAAAKEIVKTSPHWVKLSPQKFYGEIIPLVQRRPEDWGFPISWKSRPNWTNEVLGEFIAQELWGKPFHPQCDAARRWNGLSFKYLKRLANGEKPTRVLSSWEFSDKELSELLDAACVNRRFGGSEWSSWLENPTTWLARHFPLGNYIPRSRLMAEWLVSKKMWKGWVQKIEVGYLPDGIMGTISPIEMLDEIQTEDLTSGVKTNPEKVFRAILARTSDEAKRQMALDNQPFPPLPWTLTAGVQYINSPKMLAEWADRMNNCSAGYRERCQNGQCFILVVNCSSMVEVMADGRVYQHQATSNKPPTDADVKTLNNWLNSRKGVKI